MWLPCFLAQAMGGNILAWILLACAIVVGGVVLYFGKRYVMAVATSYAGALGAALGVGAFLPGQHVDVIHMINDPSHLSCTQWQCYVLAGAWVVFGTMGLVVQLLMYEKPVTEAEMVEQMKLTAAAAREDAEERQLAVAAQRGGLGNRSSRKALRGASTSSASFASSAASTRSSRQAYSQLEQENKALRAQLARVSGANSGRRVHSSGSPFDAV